MAAESHVDRSIEFPDAFIKTNVIGSLNILESVRKNLEEVQKQFNEVTAEFDNAQKRVDTLEEKLSEHDLGQLAQARPGLVEKIINDASNEVGRCMEILSGSPLTEKEINATKPSKINSECPDIANPNYVPK